jgi:hypothetical protein
MTPKEKAIELVNKFMPHSSGNSNNNEAKQCALIAVDEIVEFTKYEKQKFENDRFSEDYWQEVKKEIEAL